MRKYKKGFTLIELIVVIVIIAILSVVMIPTLTKYIDRANYSKDLQQTEALNTFIENNSLLFYDMEINSREDVIKLLKADDPNRELNLTVKSKGYYLWFDIENRKIILDTYENIEKKSGMVSLSVTVNKKGCISEFFKGYYFLDEGDSSLYKVIQLIDNLKNRDENNQLSDDLGNELTEALTSVKKQFSKAYEEYVEYLNGLEIKTTSNNGETTIFVITVENGEAKIEVEDCHHENKLVLSGRKPTCTEKGLSDGEKCAYCGEITKPQTEIEALGHEEEVVKEAVAPTCTENGKTEEIKCSRCNEVLAAQEVVDALGHTLITDNEVKPTCTETGLTEGKHCSVCNHVEVAQEVIDAKGHTEVVIKEGKEATCTATGLTVETKCSVCGELKEQTTIPALGHEEVPHEAKAATCTEKGNEAYVTCTRCDYTTYKEIAALGHKYKTEWSINETVHYHECSVCGAKTDEAPHTKDYEEATEEHGIKCTKCNYVIAEQLEHVHSIKETIGAKSPTCTESGNIEYYICKCGKMFSDKELKQEIASISDTVKPALGHKEVIDVKVEPTCTKKGLTEGKHCERCNTILVAQTEVATIPHTEVVDAAVSATCTSTGLTEGKHCSVCNTVLIAQTQIATLPHTEVVDAAVPATCSSTGLTEGKHCSVCNKVLVAQTEIATLPHAELIDAAVPATCSSTGLTEGKHCSECNKVIVAQTEIATLPHTEVVDNAVAATCTLTGLTEGKHCSVCNKVLVAQTEIPAKGHSYNEAYSYNTNIVGSLGNYYTTINCCDCGAEKKIIFVCKDENGNYYSSLEKALDYSKSNATKVYLFADYELKSNVTISAGVTLYVTAEISGITWAEMIGNPTNAVQDVKSAEFGDYTTSGINAYVQNNPTYLKTTLTINSTVTVKGNIVIFGKLGSTKQGIVSNTSSYHCQIINNGKINLQDGAILDIRGYITGSGSVTTPTSGSAKIYAPLVVEDWPGGSAANSIKNKTIAPFNLWRFTNIQCEMKIEYSSSLIAYANIYAGSQWNFTYSNVISKDSGLFIMKSSSSSVRMTYNPSNGKTKYELNGSIDFGSFILKVKVSILTVDIDTADYFFPVNKYTDIVLNNGSTLSIYDKKVKFLPGSGLEVKSNASIKIDGYKKTISLGWFGSYDEYHYGELNIYNNGEGTTDNLTGLRLYGSNVAPNIIINGTVEVTQYGKIGGSGFINASSSVGGTIIINNTATPTSEESNSGNVDGTSSGTLKAQDISGNIIELNSTGTFKWNGTTWQKQ